MTVNNSRYLKIGPGGRQCACCFPRPGSKDRRAQFRSAKRKAERAALREAEQDIIEHEILIMELYLQDWEGYDPDWDYDWRDDLDPEPMDFGYDSYYDELHDEFYYGEDTY